MKTTSPATLLHAYMLFICVWFFLWLRIGDGPWWLTVLNRVVPYLFLPVIFLLVWLVRTREYRRAALLILPLSIFGNLYHPYLVPKLSNPAGKESDLRVMSYNVLFSNSDYDAVSKVILTYHPDLVALQEVLPEMMSALEDRLADEYPYSFHGTNDGYAVTAVFSRYPVSEASVISLGEDHRSIIVRVEVNDEAVVFAAVHLRAYGLQWVRPLTNIPSEIVRRTDAQNNQVEILLHELLNESGNVIIGCDCNSKETSSSYRMLDEWFENAAYHVGWQFSGVEPEGVRQDLNLQHIDFIWYRGALEPWAAYKIMETGGSDHHPVLGIFDLK